MQPGIEQAAKGQNRGYILKPGRFRQDQTFQDHDDASDHKQPAAQPVRLFPDQFIGYGPGCADAHECVLGHLRQQIAKKHQHQADQHQD